MGIKVARHELGMSDGNAEAQTLYLVDIGDIFQDGVHHKVSAALRHHGHRAGGGFQRTGQNAQKR